MFQMIRKSSLVEIVTYKVKKKTNFSDRNNEKKFPPCLDLSVFQVVLSLNFILYSKKLNNLFFELLKIEEPFLRLESCHPRRFIFI